MSGNEHAPLHGLLLAGGRSSRMGTDKTALPFAGTTLLERAANLMGEVVAEFFVSVRAEQADEALRRRYPLLIDTVHAGGPAAGILTAHRFRPAAAWLVLACDMPLVNRECLAELLRGRGAGFDAVAWKSPSSGKPEPLCAVYEPATLARFMRHVNEGGSASPQAWLGAVHVNMLEGEASGLLASANTPEELARLAAQGAPYTGRNADDRP